ncbi:OmpA family protein [Microbulbifer sp. S227A]|uniref:OmpA family protein n=1 Tax=Microbulbifer sp. S227A TaxID=3415131 RepID=UPI003C7AEA21
MKRGDTGKFLAFYQNLLSITVALSILLLFLPSLLWSNPLNLVGYWLPSSRPEFPGFFTDRQSLGALSLTIVFVAALQICAVHFFRTCIDKGRKLGSWRGWIFWNMFQSRNVCVLLHIFTYFVVFVLTYLILGWVSQGLQQLDQEMIQSNQRRASYREELKKVLWIAPLLSLTGTLYVYRLLGDIKNGVLANPLLSDVISELSRLADQSERFLREIQADDRVMDVKGFRIAIDQREKRYKRAVKLAHERTLRQTALVATALTIVSSIGPLQRMEPKDLPTLPSSAIVQELRQAFEHTRKNSSATPLQVASIASSGVYPTGAAPTPLHNYCEESALLRNPQDGPVLTDEQLLKRVTACRVMAARAAISLNNKLFDNEGVASQTLQNLAGLQTRVDDYIAEINKHTQLLTQGVVMPVQIEFVDHDKNGPVDLVSLLTPDNPVPISVTLSLGKAPFEGNTALADQLNGNEAASLPLRAALTIETVEGPAGERLAPGSPVEVPVAAKLIEPLGLRDIVSSELEEPFLVRLQTEQSGEVMDASPRCLKSPWEFRFGIGMHAFDLGLDQHREAMIGLIGELKQQRNDRTRLLLVGHADPQGNVLFNYNLAERRAEAIRIAILNQLKGSGAEVEFASSVLSIGEQERVGIGLSFTAEDNAEQRKVEVRICG